MAHEPKLWKLTVKFRDEDHTDTIYGTEQQVRNQFHYLLGWCPKPKTVELYRPDRTLWDSGEV